MAAGGTLQSITDTYNYYIREKSDPRLEGYPLAEGPLPILIIVCSYYHFIKYSGPKYMEKRKPFQLKKIMIAYNALQCICNAWAIFQGLLLLQHPEIDLKCAPLSYSTDPVYIKYLRLTYFYFILKVVDLLDTIFMVLRKNYHQITFLHVYHHIGMSLGSYLVLKYLPTGQLGVVGFLNCIVHTVMYFYYLLTAYNSDLKKSIWWKKHITELQMLQFFLILCHHTMTLFNPNCDYPKKFLVFFIFQNFFIFYLFAEFYYKAYIKPNKKKES